MKTVIYTADPQLRSPRRLLGQMRADLGASWGLAWRLTIRDIKAQYRRSILGILWAFIPPVVTALVFIALNRGGVIEIRETDLPYAAFALFGTTLWFVFTEALNSPLKVMNANRSMFSKVKFPPEALILSAAGSVLFQLIFKVIILIGVFIYFKLPLTWELAAAPFAILALLVLGLTIGLFIAPMGLLYSDVASALAPITMLWLFVTPVIYPPPQAFPYSLLNDLNPVSPLLVGARDLGTGGSISNPVSFGVVTGLAVCGLLLAWLVYRVSIPILVERTDA